MTRDVRLSAQELDKLKLQPHRRAGERVRPLEKYQIFEVVTAAVFARLKPDYAWWVSPNRADGGVDFVGRGPFLKSDILGIDASILIGGECKKRSDRKALDDLRSSLLKMCDTLRPTFIVGVVSAPVTTLKIEEAKQLLERQLHRHCHIFGRHQIETILARQIDIISAVLKKALEPPEVEQVLQYFRDLRGPALQVYTGLDPISAVMGWSFSVSLEIHHTSPGLTVQLRWLPVDGTFIRLIAPCGADAPLGSQRTLGSDIVAPFVDHLDIEFVTYRVGENDLGALEITASDGETTTVALPKAEVAPDLRPSFYARPYQGVMDAIAEAFARARSGRPIVVAVTGSGGAGKTRMCQETAIEARRQGADYIAAEQPNSSERPYRLFADLLLSLTADRSIGRRSPADPTELLARLQPELAERAAPAIRALVESAGLASTDDQVLLSAFILLISAKSRNVSLVIHLQNLHWCTQDALEFVERLIWQLQQIADSSAVSGSGVPVRVLFLLEGRTHEQRAQVDAGWSTRAFERSLDRIRCTRLSCASFDRLQSAEFVERLFETAGSAVRQIPNAVLPLQKPILDAIVRASGGNPFLILEQVRWLRQQNILAINPRSGLLYLLRPPVGALALPRAVADIIHARWRYWAEQSPAVGRLVLAAALFEDRLPALLFRHLWRTLAPEVSRQQLEGLELFRFPRGSVGSDDFAFAHENYFHALGGLTLAAEDHKAILRAYLDWFKNRSEQDPELLFIQARALLQDESANRSQVEVLLRKVVSLSNEQRKQALAARATAVLLDEIAWPLSRSRGDDHARLVEACKGELILADYLIMSGNRNLAQERMELALGHVSKALAYAAAATAPDAVERCRLLLGAMLARTLFNNGAPVRAASITEDLVADVRHLVPDPGDEDPTRRSLLMEILHTHAVATALAGEISVALLVSARAAAIAETLIGHDQRPLEVISTYGNIAIADSPSLALDILTACAPHAMQADASSRLRLRLEINTAMARIVLGYDARASDPEASVADLRLAAAAMRAAYRRANTVGRHSDAAAAALLLGLALTLLGEDARTKFADAVAAASRAGQFETLWRAQINLAHSLNAAGESPLESAAAALAILTGTLESSAEADTSPRYRMVAAPLAQATLYCLRAGDPRAAAVLRRFPALANMFSDSPPTRLRDDRCGFRSREWLQVGDVDYILY